MSRFRSDQIADSGGLISAIHTGWRPKYLFFWSHEPCHTGQIGKHCLSQWWEAPFTVAGQTYLTAEHFMMAEKARLFDDGDSLKAILSSPHPGAAKQIGRQVAGFDETIWSEQRFEIVVRGNLAKFQQHASLQSYLVQTGDRVLAEASPVDRIWGIGLTADDPRAYEPRDWQGSNWLGFALMRVRAVLREGTAP